MRKYIIFCLAILCIACLCSSCKKQEKMNAVKVENTVQSYCAVS